MGYNTQEVLRSARESLKEAGVMGEMDAVFLLEEVVGTKVSLVSNLTDEQYYRFLDFVERRKQHEPLDSIIGYTEFMGVKISFDKNTLTPRQETEIMVDNIVSDNKSRKDLKILDLCSGSGCIGLALKKHLDSCVTLVDISCDALIHSQYNASNNDLDVKIIESNLFENIDEQFDIIVSNPPYIPSEDIRDLEKEVLDYDPILALDGGLDGLDFYRTISLEAPKYLKENGIVYVEFGICQSLDIAKMFEENFEDIEIKKDYNGIDRYLKARKKSYVK